jgi:hypothetical protein
VSAAIIIQNITNRLRHSKIDWHLSEEEMLEKRLAWAKNIKDIKRIEAVLGKFICVAVNFIRQRLFKEEAISRISTK